MSVTLKGQKEQEHNGFYLEDSFSHAGDILVLTGRNGCGKTRLLESISRSKTAVELDGTQITVQDIKFLKQENLTPDFGANYSDVQFQNKITSSLQQFDRLKAKLDAPLSTDAHDRHMMGRGDEEGLPFVALHGLCNSVANDLGKKPSELTHDDIKMHFEDHIENILGFQNISAVCNQYIRRKNLNGYNEYRATRKENRSDVTFYTDDEFLKRFGSKPWERLNKIVKATFDDKFYFSEPDETLESYSYNQQFPAS